MQGHQQQQQQAQHLPAEQQQEPQHKPQHPPLPRSASLPVTGTTVVVPPYHRLPQPPRLASAASLPPPSYTGRGAESGGGTLSRSDSLSSLVDFSDRHNLNCPAYLPRGGHHQGEPLEQQQQDRDDFHRSQFLAPPPPPPVGPLGPAGRPEEGPPPLDRRSSEVRRREAETGKGKGHGLTDWLTD